MITTGRKPLFFRPGLVGSQEGDELVPAVAANAKRVFGERLTVGDLFTSYAKSFSTRVVPDCWWSGIWKAIAGTSAFSGTALRARRYSPRSSPPVRRKVGLAGIGECRTMCYRLNMYDKTFSDV